MIIYVAVPSYYCCGRICAEQHKSYCRGVLLLLHRLGFCPLNPKIHFVWLIFPFNFLSSRVQWLGPVWIGPLKFKGNTPPAECWFCPLDSGLSPVPPLLPYLSPYVKPILSHVSDGESKLWHTCGGCCCGLCRIYMYMYVTYTKENQKQI